MIDVAVVGSGHNALVAACYLARAGLTVEVVERDSVLGGAVSTVERFAGHRVDRGSSLHVMVRHTGIVEELELGECGLRYLDADPWGFAPPDLLFSTDLDATCASIEASCGADDATAYRRLVTDLAPATKALFSTFTAPPTMGRIARHTAHLTRRQHPAELSRWFLQPAEHLLDATFRSERLKAAIAWLVSQSGPPAHEPATVGHLMWVALMHHKPPQRPIGGSGMLTQALAERLRRDGGTVRLGDGAVEFLHSGSRVTGIRTASGSEIRARAVLSGAHILTTLDLLGDLEPAGARRRIRVGDGIGIAVRLATTALPAYPDAPSGALHGMQLLVQDRRELRAAYGDYLAGRPPASPAVLAMTPTALDPGLSPPGEHVVTLWAQWHRYDLPWDDLRDHTVQTTVAAVERRAPGFAASVTDSHLQSPLDLEREIGLRGGNVMHVEMALDAMFSLRPLPEMSGYRTGVPGLYLTGATTHPGGGVFGAPGRNAAKVLTADLRRGLRHRGGPCRGGLRR